MRMIKSDIYISNKRSPMRDIITQFEQSNQTQVEILDWQKDYKSINAARSSAAVIIDRHFKGRVKVSTRGERLFLKKEDIDAWNYNTVENCNYDGKRFVGIKECAKITGLSEHYLRNGIRQGLIPVITSGVKYLVDMYALQTTMDSLSIKFIQKGDNE